MENRMLEHIVLVPTKCEKCGVEGMAPTFKDILENKEAFLTKMLDNQGYADILCVDCAIEATSTDAQDAQKEATE
jgi:hypothetical protein